MQGTRGRMTRRELLALIAALAGSTAGASEDRKAAKAPDPVKLNPRSYRVAFENERVRVLEYHSKPGVGVCGQGRHYHPAHLTIGLTGGKVKVRKEDGTVAVKESKPGSVFWAPAEIHEVENLSGRNMQAYIVEYKDEAWKPSTG